MASLSRSCKSHCFKNSKYHNILCKLLAQKLKGKDKGFPVLDTERWARS